MFHCRTALVILALVPSPVLAVTADQVWENWQSLAADAGTPLTASPRRDGDKLVLSGLALALGDAANPTTLRLERVVLRDNPDGTVAVVLPDSFPLTLDLPEPLAPTDPDRLTFITSAPGLALTIAGLGRTAAFDLAAASLTVTMTLPSGTPDQLTFTLAAADLDLHHSNDFVSPRSKITSTLSLGALHADMALAVPGGPNGSATLDLSRLAAGLDAAALATALTRNDAPPADILRTLSDDVRLVTSLTYGPLSMAINGAEPGTPPVDFTLTSASGDLRISFDDTGLRYALASGVTRIDATVADPTIPVSQIGFGYSETALGLAFGLGTTAQPFSTYARLTDLSLDDPLWAALDPAASFPRTPFAIDLALSGQYAVNPAALQPGWQPTSAYDQRIDILALTLDTLLLKGLGTTFTGAGALSFDKTDLTTYDGVPAPTGSLSFTATGLNALVDTLSQASLLTPDQLTGLRFALAFIAKPGDAPDSLTSKVEFAGKSFSLNGQKLR